MQKARYLRKGDIIEYTSESGAVRQEVVREVVIVLRLANGESISVDTVKEYKVLPQEALEAPVDEDAAVAPVAPAIVAPVKKPVP